MVLPLRQQRETELVFPEFVMVKKPNSLAVSTAVVHDAVVPVEAKPLSAADELK